MRTMLKLLFVALLLTACREKPAFTTLNLITHVHQLGLYTIEGLGPIRLEGCLPGMTRENTAPTVTIMFFAPEVMPLELRFSVTPLGTKQPMEVDVNGYHVFTTKPEQTAAKLAFKAQKGLNVIAVRCSTPNPDGTYPSTPPVVFHELAVSASR